MLYILSTCLRVYFLCLPPLKSGSVMPLHFGVISLETSEMNDNKTTQKYPFDVAML